MFTMMLQIHNFFHKKVPNSLNYERSNTCGFLWETSIYTRTLNFKTSPKLATSCWISIASSHVCGNTKTIDPSTRSGTRKQEIEFNMYPYCTRDKKKHFPPPRTIKEYSIDHLQTLLKI